MTLNFTPKPVTLALMQPRTLAFILFTAYVIMCMCGCAHKKLVAPSTARVATHVGSAQQHNAQAQRYNDLNRTTAERIDAKTQVIEKYWK